LLCRLRQSFRWGQIGDSVTTLTLSHMAYTMTVWTQQREIIVCVITAVLILMMNLKYLWHICIPTYFAAIWSSFKYTASSRVSTVTLPRMWQRRSPTLSYDFPTARSGTGTHVAIARSKQCAACDTGTWLYTSWYTCTLSRAMVVVTSLFYKFLATLRTLSNAGSRFRCIRRI
jgi:hypothetical protein